MILMDCALFLPIHFLQFLCECLAEEPASPDSQTGGGGSRNERRVRDFLVQLSGEGEGGQERHVHAVGQGEMPRFNCSEVRLRALRKAF